MGAMGVSAAGCAIEEDSDRSIARALVRAAAQAAAARKRRRPLISLQDFIADSVVDEPARVKRFLPLSGLKRVRRRSWLLRIDLQPGSSPARLAGSEFVSPPTPAMDRSFKGSLFRLLLLSQHPSLTLRTISDMSSITPSKLLLLAAFAQSVRAVRQDPQHADHLSPKCSGR